MTGPRWRRRKTARPAEIVSAALDVFSEKGFAAARLDEIARRAGISKGALYLYFETKDELFRAVVRDMASPNVEAMRAMAEAAGGRFAEFAPRFLARIAEIASGTRLPAVAKLVIGESRNFPDLARVWHETVVSQAIGLVSGLIARAQAAGEVKPGDARLYAVSLVGPMVTAFIWNEVFVPAGVAPLDPRAMAEQHARTVLGGMLVEEPRP